MQSASSFINTDVRCLHLTVSQSIDLEFIGRHRCRTQPFWRCCACTVVCSCGNLVGGRYYCVLRIVLSILSSICALSSAVGCLTSPAVAAAPVSALLFTWKKPQLTSSDLHSRLFLHPSMGVCPKHGPSSLWARRPVYSYAPRISYHYKFPTTEPSSS